MSFTLYRDQNNKWIRSSHAGIKSIVRLVTHVEGGGGGGGGGEDPPGPTGDDPDPPPNPPDDDQPDEGSPPDYLVVRIYNGWDVVYTETVIRASDYDGAPLYVGTEFVSEIRVSRSEPFIGWVITTHISTLPFAQTFEEPIPTNGYYGVFADNPDQELTATVSLT